MSYTGGPLNELNGKMGISAPENSVPVMKLIRAHNPFTKSDLVDLINNHYINECHCGIRSTGSVESFGKNLYNAQRKYWGEIKFSLEECIQWEYDLFISQSMKGRALESVAISLLNKKFSELKFTESKGMLDEELRIDILVSSNHETLCGIQVKPESFLNMRKEVVEFNHGANSKWNKSVYYLFYNENEKFSNLDYIFTELNKYLITN